jgi:hypothetical protein
VDFGVGAPCDSEQVVVTLSAEGEVRGTSCYANIPTLGVAAADCNRTFVFGFSNDPLDFDGKKLAGSASGGFLAAVRE